MKRILYCLILPLCVLSACTSVKNMTLAHDVTEEMIQPAFPEFVVEVGDELNIIVSSLNEEAAAPFNKETNYIVGVNGAIKMPILGEIDVVGKSVKQIKDEITSLLADNLQNVFVQIYFPKAAVTILGEVNTPQRISISKPITILEAIGIANGLTTNARYKEVEVLRTQADKVVRYIVDLTSQSLFQSPCYYLTKGDVVNVRPLHSVVSK